MVHVGSYGELQENSFCVSNFNYSCSTTDATKRNTAGLFIWFCGRGQLRHGIQRKLNAQAFTADYTMITGKFFTSLTR